MKQSDKKKILFLSSWYPNKNAPTLGNFVQKHAEAAALYNDVTVIAIFPHNEKFYTLESNEKNGVKSVLSYYPQVSCSIPVLKQFLQYYRTRKAFLKAYNYARTTFGKPNLVHVNVVYPIGLWAKRLKTTEGLPYVVTEHSTAFHPGSNKLSATALKLGISWMNHAERILPVSEDLKISLEQRGVTQPMEVISNVVNEQIFGNLPPVEPVKTTFIHISTAVDAHKNVSGIVRSIAELSKKNVDFQFLIVSDGELAPFIDLAYRQLNISHDLLQFEGTKTTEEIADLINHASALVLFSNFENFPCVIPEAFMAGKPVISTNVNGIPEHVNQHNGILVEAQNEEQLVAALSAVIDHQIHFDPAAIKSYAHDHFSYQAVGKKMDAVYAKILNTHVS